MGIPLAWVGVQLAVAAATGIPVVFGELPMAALVFVAVFVLVALVGGGQEEFGWRGWLQTALQEHTTPLGAAVVAGLVWGSVSRFLGCSVSGRPERADAHRTAATFPPRKP